MKLQRTISIFIKSNTAWSNPSGWYCQGDIVWADGSFYRKRLIWIVAKLYFECSNYYQHCCFPDWLAIIKHIFYIGKDEYKINFDIQLNEGGQVLTYVTTATKLKRFIKSKLILMLSYFYVSMNSNKINSIKSTTFDFDIQLDKYLEPKWRLNI